MSRIWGVDCSSRERLARLEGSGGWLRQVDSQRVELKQQRSCGHNNGVVQVIRKQSHMRSQIPAHYHLKCIQELLLVRVNYMGMVLAMCDIELRAL